MVLFALTPVWPMLLPTIVTWRGKLLGWAFSIWIRPWTAARVPVLLLFEFNLTWFLRATSTRSTITSLSSSLLVRLVPLSYLLLLFQSFHYFIKGLKSILFRYSWEIHLPIYLKPIILILRAPIHVYYLA